MTGAGIQLPGLGSEFFSQCDRFCDVENKEIMAIWDILVKNKADSVLETKKSIVSS